jgi:hypothetical protein
VSAYDHIMVLLSFVYALAIAHLLSRVGALLLARKRVRFSGLQALAMFNAGSQPFLNWLVSRNTHGVAVWSLADITLSFLFAVTNFLVCAAAAPEMPAEGPVDLEAFYWENRRLFWGLLLLMFVAALAANLALLKMSEPNLFVQATLLTLPFFLPSLLAITVRARWAQWAAGLGLAALSIGWGIIFTGVIR